MRTLSDTGRLNLRILPAVAFTFVVYLAIGLPLAVLPSYVCPPTCTCSWAPARCWPAC
jgi:hypothetical protein